MSNIDYLMMDILMTKDYRSKRLNPEITGLITTINNNFLDSQFDLSAAMKNTGYSLSHLRKLFRSFTGISPIEFLNQRRIEYAKKRMQDQEELSLKRIAHESGFSDPNYFSRIFKKIEHITPSQYQEYIKKSKTKR